jgi:hypothetical protein
MEAKLFYKGTGDKVELIPIRYERLPPVLFLVGERDLAKNPDTDQKVVEMEVREYVDVGWLPLELSDKIHELIQEKGKEKDNG